MPSSTHVWPPSVAEGLGNRERGEIRDLLVENSPLLFKPDGKEGSVLVQVIEVDENGAPWSFHLVELA